MDAIKEKYPDWSKTKGKHKQDNEVMRDIMYTSARIASMALKMADNNDQRAKFLAAIVAMAGGLPQIVVEAMDEKPKGPTKH
jgi:hypothetical protein